MEQEKKGNHIRSPIRRTFRYVQEPWGESSGPMLSLSGDSI